MNTIEKSLRNIWNVSEKTDSNEVLSDLLPKSHIHILPLLTF